jgi:cell fate regulator YaaT (PSP1 superfamily)
MGGVVGVRFAKAGKIFNYDAGDEEFSSNDYIVVETDVGIELGYVVITPSQVVMTKFKGPLTPIVRRATPEDLQERDRLLGQAREMSNKCRELVKELDLPMKTVEAVFTLDGLHLVISYTADDRVDFRQLLRRLGRTVQAKVELRQIGPRDQTKVMDGLGRCGRTLCCSTWLVEFQPVTMKMAKEQDLPLSPPGLAGVCGRLRCCLRYEYDQYRELKRGLPKVGSTVQTGQGPAVVVVGHPLKQTITVRLENGTWVEVPMDELQEKAPV